MPFLPNVIGMSLSNAVDALSHARVEVGTIEDHKGAAVSDPRHEPAASSIVDSTDPDPGTECDVVNITLRDPGADPGDGRRG